MRRLWLHIRWWHHRRMLRAFTRSLYALFDSYDCGAHMIDILTRGRLSRYQREITRRVGILKEIDKELCRDPD